MADEQKPTQFPNYPPQGIPVGDQRQARPLMKMLRQMLKPKRQTIKHRTLKWKTKKKFY